MLAGSVFAKEVSILLKLVDIKAEKTSEAAGDELYFDITQYPNLGRPRSDRIPLYPLHWVSNQLSQAKNVILWEGSLAEGESIKLILSLVEQDNPPWDMDDLLGSAELVLANYQGKLKKEWSIPSFVTAKTVEMKKKASPQRYIFKGDNSRYDVALVVEQK